MSLQKIVVIVGPTSSGKTSLSVQIAKKYNGEIVSADSRQVYVGLNLGTGKVTQEEMGGVPHHLLDVVDPHEIYTVTEYVRTARPIINDILARKKLPIITGGTFLYIDTLLGKMSTSDVPPNPNLRAILNTLSTEELSERLKSVDPERHAHIDTHNRVRLIRSLEIIHTLKKVPKSIPKKYWDMLILGIMLPKETLHHAIHTRLISRLDAGMIEEVQNLHRGGLSYARMEKLGIEYTYIAQYLQKLISYDEMIHQIEIKTRQYAKRQMTWLKRDPEIIWIEKNDTNKIENVIDGFLKNQLDHP